MTGRTALRRIATGTAVIIRGLGWAGEWSETLARWFIAALAASLAAVTVAVHPWLTPVAILGWMAAAAAAAGTEDDEGQDDEPDDDEQVLDADAFTELVRDLADGGNVHLVAIRRQLALELPGDDWSGPAVTALCNAAGIRVRPGVRVPGAQPAVTTGIHRDDIPPLPQPHSTPPVGVVGAGHHSNNNTNTLTTEPIGEGGLLIKHGASTHQEARS